MDIWPQEDTPQYTYSEAFRNMARERDAAIVAAKEAHGHAENAQAIAREAIAEAREWREVVGKLYAMFVMLAEVTRLHE